MISKRSDCTRQESAKAIARFFITGGWCFSLAACSGGSDKNQTLTNNTAQSPYIKDVMTNSPMENAADENGVEHHRPPLEH